MGPNDAVRAELQKAAGEAQLAFWKAKADRLAKTPEQAAGRLPMGLGSGFSPHVNPENVYQTVEASIVFDFFFAVEEQTIVVTDPLTCKLYWRVAS